MALYIEYKNVLSTIEDLNEMLEEKDPEIVEMAEMELEEGSKKQTFKININFIIDNPIKHTIFYS